MPNFEMDLSVPTNSKKLFELAIDFENFKKFSPAQIKDISIIEKSDDVITTEEILTFKTILKDIEIKQKTKHTIDYPSLISNVIEGPFKNTNLNIEFIEEEPIKTKVSINADVKISLKYSMLSPIISRLYKGIITGLIYKMTNSILRNDVT
jgi:ribosome-associated toxin RatA of RatAB toxin-antitoxin module|tara:strand:+ start:18180 stop:18632 length:453 start_codon:yes stop_codon:yes gene_type:complete